MCLRHSRHGAESAVIDVIAVSWPSVFDRALLAVVVDLDMKNTIDEYYSGTSHKE